VNSCENSSCKKQTITHYRHTLTNYQTVLRPFFREHPLSQCQMRTYGFYGAGED